MSSHHDQGWHRDLLHGLGRRPGHGRSSQALAGNDMNGDAGDLAALVKALGLYDATVVGEPFDGLLAGRFKDRSQFCRDFASQFYGANRLGVGKGVLDQFWTWGMQAGLKNSYGYVKALSGTGFKHLLPGRAARHLTDASRPHQDQVNADMLAFSQS